VTDKAAFLAQLAGAIATPLAAPMRWPPKCWPLRHVLPHSGGAWTANSFRQSTSALAGMLQEGRIPNQVQHNPGALLVGGGLLVEAHGQIIGGIGVSGVPRFPRSPLSALHGPPTRRVPAVSENRFEIPGETVADYGPPLIGVAFVLLAAIGFSAKAVLVKLAYLHGVDAVMLLALRMSLSVPFGALAVSLPGRGK
jgi:hypothetical protein